MEGDLDNLDVPMVDYVNEENEESSLMKVDVSDTSSGIYSEKRREETEKDDDPTQSVVLSILCASKPHRSCIVCPKMDAPSMHVLSDEQRSMVLVNRGILVTKFRDTTNALLRLGRQVVMPGILHNEKQFSANEANRTRLVTKT
ncbi:unnamed protein product [Rotaria magnacalcarata]|uniref:Uncharacterized protein n=1 Tax=Rotaria magnacalcarata TaxID=392030 RepID=A0A819ITB0_9BILA|nr:unnamed protein product [Rotaria magnacalcarata]